MSDEKTAKRRVTLRDVAQAAGVSLKTASNVINGSGRMTDETRAKVESVIKDLDYRVNVAARNLNRDHTGFITLAVPSLIPPYLAELANRTIEAARQRDYSVYVTTYAEGSAKGARDLLKKFNSTVSDGMILSMSEVENISPDDLKVDFPLVIVGARTTRGIVDHVTPDDVLLNAVEGNAQLRLRGIIEETRRRGLSLDPQLIGNTDQDWTIGAGARVTQRLIDSGVPFDGVIALNDQLAIGALTALRTAGYEVPVQVQVIGFDNNEEAPYLQIPLTTMDSRLDWTAPTAVDRILGRIDGSITKSELLTTESQVIARASTR